jgi:hypothetical protein
VDTINNAANKHARQIRRTEELRYEHGLKVAIDGERLQSQLSAPNLLIVKARRTLG